MKNMHQKDNNSIISDLFKLFNQADTTMQKQRKRKKKMEFKKIEINGITKSIDKITTNDMITFIEKEHPEDRKKFAKLVFDNTKVYNHMAAKNKFLQLYFPEVLKKEVQPKISDTIYSWLSLEED